LTQSDSVVSVDRSLTVNEDRTNALLSDDKDNPNICYGFEPGAAQRMNPESRFTEELSPTIRANMGDNQAAVVYGLDRASFNQGKNAKYDFAVEEEIAQPLVARGPGGVMTP
jgi:hypothetical protein